MLRATLLYLSRQKHLRRWMENSPSASLLTRRFIAGNTLEQGLGTCRLLRRQGFLATLDHLGENVTSAAEAEASKNAYLLALERLAPLELGATISIKLSQLGMDISSEICGLHLDQLATRARQLGSAVEVDMEGSNYTDRILELVCRTHARHGAVRAVIQAYLFRSEGDVRRLNEARVPVRLCKGAYMEPASLAFQRKQDVDANFLKLMQILLADGVYPAVASHDERIVRRAMAFTRERRIEPERFEFQMLYGIRRDLQKLLLKEGFRLRLYVPYGDAWYPYFMRRLAERPANLLFLLRNLIRR